MTARAARCVAFGMALVVALGLVTPTRMATAAVPPLLRGKPAKPVAGRDAPPGPARPPIADSLSRKGPLAQTWPSAASADITAGRTPASVTVGGLPVSLTTPASGSAAPRMAVSVLDQATTSRLGVTGIALRIGPAGTPVADRRMGLSVGYGQFRDAYGGDWADRLRLLQLPTCALTTPRATTCRPLPLPSRNDAKTGTVTADIDLPGTGDSLVALAAGASGSTGDYTATSLSLSSSWQVSAQTGDFSWSYPLRLPPSPGGLQPNLVLSYASGSVDGRTASTNTQPSAVGEGWDLWPGYVERRYRACSDDGKQTSDLCWGPDNATLVLNGRAVELVHDDDHDVWRPRSDDGSRIEHLTDSGTANGDNDGEFWRVTTQDGTQYLFGRNRLPGWSANKPVTGSTWLAQVFGNNAGEPCPSGCKQAWRWNLDYVVDPHGNAVAYYYQPETNNYGSAGTGYTRGGYLLHADYGFRDGHAYDTNAATAVVSFGMSDRCDAASSGCTSWPDTPTDQACSTAACTASQAAPTFWSRKRLTSITIRVLKGTAYSDVDRWDFGQSFPTPGDGQNPALWLTSIKHTGLVGGSLATPPVTFDPLPLQNRVNPATFPPMRKMRIGAIHTEAGGIVGVTYAPAECTAALLPAAQDTNTKRCFAQWWSPPAQSPILDWFHKHVVSQVTVSDPIGGSKQEETDYSYLDGGAWHYADSDETTAVAKRTWSGWRGYGRVQVRHGSPAEGQSLVEDRFYRGMDGDRLAAGGTRSVTVADSEGNAVPDLDGLSGQVREHTAFNGPDGAEVSGTISTPYRSAAAAAHTHDGLTVAAYQVRPGGERGRVDLDGGRLRRTAVDRSYDSDGRLMTVDDQGDTSTADDDRCARTSYASDPARGMLAFPAKVSSVGVRCSSTPRYPADGLSEQRTYYDGSTRLGTVSGAGDATRKDTAKAYDGSGPSAFTTSSSTYDVYGRVHTETDTLQRITTTDYTGVPVTQTKVTNPLQFTTTTTLDPGWGLPTSTVDVNARRTDLAYDPLGRLTAVWLPDRPKASNSTGSIQFGYQLSNAGPSWVRTDKLAPSSLYLTSYTLFDGLLRQRQTQAPAEGSGRLITDTFYNTRGLPYLAFNPYFTSGSPGTALFQTTPTLVPSETVTSYDGAERATTVDSRRYDDELWHITTVHHGDHTDVTPPAGGTPTSMYADARGHTTELRQYHGSTPTGSYDATHYKYSTAGLLTNVTDPAGIEWTNEYDPLGRPTTSAGPDTGRLTMTYDDAGQLLTATDARNRTLAYAYDSLGRRTGEYSGSTSGTQLAGWTYDTLPDGTVVKGQRASSVRYDGGNVYTEAVTGYDTNYRPTGTSVTVPAAETGLGGTYTTGMTYALDGKPASVTLPAAGGLPVESVRVVYDAVGLPFTLKGATSYVVDSQYSSYGEPSVYTMSTGSGPAVQLSYDFEDGTHRLTRARLVRQTASDRDQADAHYSYDPAGNLTSVADTPNGHPADTQCFDYDYLRRLTQAWTPTSGDCSAAPAAAAGILGGPAPYWTSYGYDSTGNRTSQIQHDPDGNPADDTTTTYSYPFPEQAQPHTLQAVVTAGPGGARTRSYGYDEDGNTTSYPGPDGQQTLDWDIEGRLHSATGPAGTRNYVYDADGNRLVERDPMGATLYLPNGMELRRNAATGTVTGTRYYAHNGTTVAVRTTAGVTWLATDPHGTANFAIIAATAAVITRRTDPFGNVRGSPPNNWPDTHGFLNKALDPGTGLTHLGARDYDATLGRFTSTDPVTDPNDPQQLNGYGYANNNPVGNADPTGLSYCNSGPDGTCPLDEHGHVRTPNPSGTAQSQLHPMDRTTPHNQAVRAAEREILNQAAQHRWRGRILDRTEIAGAAKKCLYNREITDCSYGIADVLWEQINDDGTRVIFVWEVKAVREATKARPEAEWYVAKLVANGDRAVLGWTIGGPYPVGNGHVIIGPEDGAVIYGQPKDPQDAKVPEGKRTIPAVTTAPKAQANPRAPTQAAPEAVPGAYPGTAYQPGLGTVPLCTSCNANGAAFAAGVFAVITGGAAAVTTASAVTAEVVLVTLSQAEYVLAA